MNASLPILRLFAGEGALTLRVAGDCMSPTLRRGELVDVVGQAFYLPGDVVAFQRADGELVVHRFLGYAPKGSGLACILRADDASRRDAAVPMSRVLGRVVSHHADGQAVRVTAIDRFAACAKFLGEIVMHLRKQGAR